MLSAIGTPRAYCLSNCNGAVECRIFCCSRLVACKTAKELPDVVLAPTSVCWSCSLSRIALGFIPNVMPVTIMAVMVGSKFGAQRGVSFAILVTLASNAVLGHGWWSMFQMIGWGSVAAAASMMTVHDSRGELSMNRLLHLFECSGFQHHRFIFNTRFKHVNG